jgi:hypothetical protein
MPKASQPPGVFLDPWHGSLGDRLSNLSGADFRVFYFYEHPDSASFRYRCYNMAQAINSSPESVSATYIFLSDLEALGNPSALADVLVVCRTRYDSNVERLIAAFRSAGKKVFFDIDDLIFDTQYAPLVASNLNFDLWGEGLDKWFSLISRMGATMMLCDEVITTNTLLSTLAHEFSGLPTHVIPNFLNNEQLEKSARLLADKKTGTPHHETRRFGYFSGSKSHKKDFDVALDAIAQTMARHSAVELLVVGHLELPEKMREFSSRIEHQDFTDFISLQSLISSVDLCLAPLQDSVFTHSKSQLKFFEAGVVAVPTMATPTPVFEEAIQHGTNGFLTVAGSWDRDLEMVLEMGPKRLRAVGENAHKVALRDFSPSNHRDSILTTLKGGKPKS